MDYLPSDWTEEKSMLLPAPKFEVNRRKEGERDRRGRREEKREERRGEERRRDEEKMFK